MITDRYTMLGELGRGGMGVVWHARDERLGREVAIKQILTPHGLSADAADSRRQRMLREARAAAQIRHRNVVTVHDVLLEDDGVHIVMEYVPARSLAELVAAEGPLSPDRAARIGLDLLAVLSTAHAMGIVHRDVKPANVLVLPGDEVKLADFGIAFLAGDPTLTGQFAMIGSPAYMSPEQVRGRSSSPATDLWSLAATLYFAVEGKGPFDAESAAAAIAAVVGDVPAAPRNTDEALDELLYRLLTKDPDARPDAEWARERLTSAAGGQSPAPTRSPQRSVPGDTGSGDTGPGREGKTPPGPVPPLPGEAFTARLRVAAFVRRPSRVVVAVVLVALIGDLILLSQADAIATSINNDGQESGSGNEIAYFALGAVALAGLVIPVAAAMAVLFCALVLVVELPRPRHLKVTEQGIELVRGFRRLRLSWQQVEDVRLVGRGGARQRVALMLRPVRTYPGPDPLRGQWVSSMETRPPWEDGSTGWVGVCYLDELRAQPGQVEAALRHFVPRLPAAGP